MRTTHAIALAWMFGLLSLASPGLAAQHIRRNADDEADTTEIPAAVSPRLVEMPRIDIDVSKLEKNINDNNEGEIYNGSAAASGEFPAFALLVYAGIVGGGCGGVLITDRHVLTAAHCFVRSDGSTFVPVGVRIGATTSLVDGTFYSVSSATYHPSYFLSSSGMFSLRNDVAVLTLASTVTGVTPLSINRDSQASSTSGTAVTAIGFGTFDAAGNVISTFLRKTTVGTQTDAACASGAAAIGAAYVDREHMCTYAANTGTCRGDSGGPALTSANVVLGVLSFGSASCPADTADYWTDIWNYAGWIDSQTGTPGTPTPAPTPAPATPATPAPTLDQDSGCFFDNCFNFLEQVQARILSLGSWW